MTNRRVIVISLAMLLLCTTFVGGYLYGGYKSRKDLEPLLLVGERYKVVRTPGGLLEVSTIKKNESFAWETSWTCPANLCGYLPSSSSEISAEVHYTYRIPLAEFWVLEKISSEPMRYRLKVPRLEPKLPVTVSLPTIRVTDRGSVFSPSGPSQQKMQTNMQPILESRAKSKAYIQAQQQEAAKTVEEFARKWMRDGEYKIPDRAAIEIVF